MIIKIEANKNGSHSNQSLGPSVIPEGWAYVPDWIEIPNTFPFVDIELDEEGNVISMTAGIVPEESEPQPVSITEGDILSMTIDHEYRLTLLELNTEVI